ncbi:hypothetical protein ABPG74_017324 [Tetrahymena malaccensis]
MFSTIYSKIISNKIQELLNIKNNSQGWKLEKQGNLLTYFSSKYQDNQVNLAKFEGVIPVKFENAVKYYHEGLQNECRQKNCGDLEYLEKIDDNTHITLGKLRGNFLFDPRDLLTVQNTHQLNQDEVLITRTDINSHHFYVQNPQTIRADTKVYGIFLKKLDPVNTYLEAYFLYDLKGRIPAFIQTSMMKYNYEVLLNDIRVMKQL